MEETFLFKLSTPGQNILLGSAVLIAVLWAVITIRKFKTYMDRFLIIAISIFLLLYIPIFELWILNGWSFWPEGFIPLPLDLAPPTITNHHVYFAWYLLLQALSTLFLVYSIIVLINLTQNVSEKTTSWDKIKLKIPLINIAFLGIELRKLLYPNTFLKGIVAPWMLLAALWVYFKFLANPLVEWGIDSYSYLDRFFFTKNFSARVGETGDKLASFELSPIGYDYASIFVMNNMVVAFVTFLAGISTLGLAIGIQKFADLKQMDLNKGA